MKRNYASALAFSAILLSAACREDGSPNPVVEMPNPDPVMSDCPGDALSLCDLKLAASPRHPQVDAPLELEGLLVTTATHAVSVRDGEVTAAAFYVTDPVSSEKLGGRYSAIVVSYAPQTIAGELPVIGDTITISGTFTTFGPAGAPAQKQIRASRVTISSRQGAVKPLLIEDINSIGRGGKHRDAYEGALIQVKSVAISAADVMNGEQEYFNAFEVEGTLVVGGELYRYNNPIIGEVFTSLAGILRQGTRPWEANLHILTPRFEGDVLPQNQPAIVRTITDIQDSNAPGHPLEMCENNGSGTIGKCARAELEDVVVTAAGGYVSSNLRAMWVQDPSDEDGQFAGIKVVYNADALSFVPASGDTVNVAGEVVRWHGGTQVQYPTIEKSENSYTIEPTYVEDPSALARDRAESHKFEGALVQLRNINVVEACLEDSRQRDHGNWLVSGNVMIGSAFSYDYNGDFRPRDIECFTGDGEPTGLCGCNNPNTGGTVRPQDQRTPGETFASITGILDFTFGDYQLQVRNNGDLVQQ